MDIYEELKIDNNLPDNDKISALEMHRQKTLRKLNTVFGNLKKERALQYLLDGIEFEISKLSKSLSNMYSKNKASYLATREMAKENLSLDMIDINTSDRNDEQEHITNVVSANTLYSKGLDAYKCKNYEKAALFFQQAADRGHLNSQYIIGMIYEMGQGVEINQEKAAYYFELSANQGLPEAQYAIGVRYNQGSGVKKNDKKSFEWILKAAEQGIQEAANIVAQFYEVGQGTPQDDIQAAIWYEKAAEYDIATAQLSIGQYYLEGVGVAQDENNGVKWIRKAAENGEVKAQLLMGTLYHDGRGVDKDEAKTVQWYEKAAKSGNAAAQYILGEFYLVEGEHQNFNLAKFWCNKSAEQGYADAQYRLGVLCFSDGKYGEAGKYFLMAAKQGNVAAQKILNEYYE